MTNSIAEVQRAINQATASGNREQLRRLRLYERELRAAQRQQVTDEKERKRLYSESRAQEVDQRNAELQYRMEELQNILKATLSVDDKIDFQKLLKIHTPAPFHPGELGKEEQEPAWSTFEPQKPSFTSRIIGGTGRYNKSIDKAKAAYDDARQKRASREEERLTKLSAARDTYGKRVWAEREAFDQHNAAVSELERSYRAGEPAGIIEYFNLVLTNSSYPEPFPQHYRLAFIPESNQLVVEYHLPTIEAVPSAKSYRYVKTKDEITIASRPVREVNSTYALLVAQVALRTIHEIFEADQDGHIETVTFNGIVSRHDPATGHVISPCIISLRTTKAQFTAINLALVDPLACLQRLNASVSKKPEELSPVRPVVEFDMTDKRFIQETDVLSDLDKRPNLMDLTPSEFEALIQNLFASMGLDTKQTRPSRDGGVDCVAFDSRPIFGGKVVIQAKRYKHTVDVSSVRDLYGTMQNEGANKGILVTTSGYGPTSYEFASGKPLELIDGGSLLFLLEEHSGVSARIYHSS